MIMRDTIRKEWAEQYLACLEETQTVENSACFSIDDINEFFLHRISRRRKYKIVGHVMRCPNCRSDFLWFHELNRRTRKFIDAAADMKLKKPPGESRRWRIREYLLCGLGLASVIVGFILIAPVSRIAAPSKVLYRDASRSDVETIFPPPRGTLSKEDLNFRWTSRISGEYFILELYDPTMVLTWQSPKLAQKETRLPPQLLKSMKAGQDYFWSVTEVRKNGDVIESPMISFRLRD